MIATEHLCKGCFANMVSWAVVNKSILQIFVSKY